MPMLDNHDLFQTMEKMQPAVQTALKNEVILQPFTDDFARRFCWASNALEGNTLDLDETVSLIDYDEVHANHTFTEYQEAKNLFHAIRQYLLPFQKKAVTEEWLHSVNAVIMNQSGDYRTGSVYIGNLAEAVYYPPEAEKVPALMDAYMRKANFNLTGNSIEKIFEEAASQHISFEWIHPFADGNGRTGRMLLNQQLINNRLLPIAFSARAKYRQAFRLYERNGDLSSMVHILASAEIESMQRAVVLFEKYRDSRSVKTHGKSSVLKVLKEKQEEADKASGVLRREQNQEQQER